MRLFVAFPIPDPVVDALSIAMRGDPDGLRWTPEDDLHCTVRFIGDVDARGADEIAARLESISILAPTVRIDGIGVFDHRKRGALWARVAPKAPLLAIHGKVERQVVLAGYAPERRAYLPHITLARWSGGEFDARPWCDRFANLASKDFRFDDLVLFESTLRPSGPQYEALFVKPLAG